MAAESDIKLGEGEEEEEDAEETEAVTVIETSSESTV